MSINSSGVAGSLSIGSYGGGAHELVSAPNVYAANRWTHACNVWATQTSRTAYVDGHAVAPDTVWANPANPAAAWIAGNYAVGNLWNPISGAVAEVAVWRAALRDTDVSLLASGACPLAVRPDALAAYWPMTGLCYPDEPDILGGHPLAMWGTMGVSREQTLIAGWLSRPRWVPRASPGPAAYFGEGGCSWSGVGVATRGSSLAPGGGCSWSGVGVPGKQSPFAPGGGFCWSGLGVVSEHPSPAPVGGCGWSGLGVVSEHSSFAPGGGCTWSGLGLVSKPSSFAPSGGCSWSGVGALPVDLHLASGGCRWSGLGVVSEHSPFTPGGGCTWSGLGVVSKHSPLAPGGGCRWSGLGVVSEHSPFAPAGGCTWSGVATAPVHWYLAGGGCGWSGVGVARKQSSFAPGGGYSWSGVGVARKQSSFAPGGGCVWSGLAVVPAQSYLAGGGFSWCGLGVVSEIHMATSGVNFLSISSTVLAGSAVHTAVATAPYLEAMDSEQAAEIEDMAGGTIVDRVLVDLGRKSAPKFGEALLVGGAFSGAYAKNGSALLSTTGTTAVTVSLAALATATGVSAVAGDTAFATVNQLVFRNLSDADMTVASGASNGLDIGLSASATLTVPAGSVVTIQSAAGLTVDGSHKNLTVTPTSGGVLALSVGGA